MQQSTWYAGDWGFWSPTGQMNPGTSTVVLTGGSVGVPWASFAQLFYNLTIDAPGDDARVSSGPLNVEGSLTVSRGNPGPQWQ